MPTSRMLAVILLSLFVSAVHAQDPAKKPGGDKKLALLKIELDKAMVALPCPPGQVPLAESCNDSTVVVAKVIVAEGTPKDVELNTIVSGGRIVSKKGSEFQWDLAGAYPGTYTFSVAATDGNGNWSDQITEKVEIVRCKCGYIDSCPSFSLDDPEPAAAGELMEFNVKVAGEQDGSLRFDWTVSAGTIESGQGTKSIKVRTDEDMAGQTLTATVLVISPKPGLACSNSASASGEVTAKKPK